MSLYSCGFDRSNAQFDFSGFNNELMDLEVIDEDDVCTPIKAKLLTELLTLTSTFSRLWQAYLTPIETLSMVESQIKDIDYNLFDNLSVEDFIQKLTILKAFTEAITLTDNAKWIKVKTLSEIMSYIESTITKDVESLKLESLFITDTVPRDLKKYVSDMINLTATLQRIRILPPLTESIILSDPTVYRKAMPVKTETLNLSDLGLLFEAQKLLTELINEHEVIAKNLATEFSDSINLIDSVQKLFGRQLIELISLTDNILKLTNNVIMELLSFTEVITKYLDKYPLIEVNDLADSIEKKTIISFMESINLIDSIFKSITKRPFTEIMSESDNIKKTPMKSAVEVMTITHSTLKFAVHKVITQILNLIEIITKFFARTYLDYLQFSDLESGVPEAAWLYSALETIPLEFEGGKT